MRNHRRPFGPVARLAFLESTKPPAARIRRRRSAGPSAFSDRPASSFPGGGPPGTVGLPACLTPIKALRSQK